MERKIAVLSNVNMNALIRMLQGGELSVYEAEGYGNELGTLMDPESSYHAFAPEITFLVMDLLELLEHDLRQQAAVKRIGNWFAGLENAIDTNVIYYISDAWLWGAETEVADAAVDRSGLEAMWKEQLNGFCERHANVRVLPYHRLIGTLGEENAFSAKMWYMGRILLSAEAQKRLCALIRHKVHLESRTAKKVLVLDLDNTLWGGLAGEQEHTPIVLSEEHTGLAYKNLQRVILQMQRQGVLLAIVSKNNEEDALTVLRGHPHMTLRPEHFAAMRINWEPKQENIRAIAAELNLGTDSFVFWDDNPEERLLIQQMLPEVAVPEFPEKPEDMASAMTAVYREYFEKAVLTAEDFDKTEQYAANAKRSELQKQAVTFEEYLEQLQIKVTNVSVNEHIQRVEALLNKTNQFNLTTRRFTPGELQQILASTDKRVFAYHVEDCFGDNGVVAALIVDVAGESPLIEDFVMSCRVMGKRVEQTILADVENRLRDEGFTRLRGVYRPTAKNKPVERLYPQLGFELVGEDAQSGSVYEISLGRSV